MPLKNIFMPSHTVYIQHLKLNKIISPCFNKMGDKNYVPWTPDNEEEETLHLTNLSEANFDTNEKKNNTTNVIKYAETCALKSKKSAFKIYKKHDSDIFENKSIEFNRTKYSLPQCSSIEYSSSSNTQYFLPERSNVQYTLPEHSNISSTTQYYSVGSNDLLLGSNEYFDTSKPSTSKDIQYSLPEPSTDIQHSLPGPNTDIQYSLPGPSTSKDVQYSLPGPNTDIQYSLPGPSTSKDIQYSLPGPSTSKDIQYSLPEPSTDIQYSLPRPSTSKDTQYSLPGQDIQYSFDPNAVNIVFKNYISSIVNKTNFNTSKSNTSGGCIVSVTNAKNMHLEGFAIETDIDTKVIKQKINETEMEGLIFRFRYVFKVLWNGVLYNVNDFLPILSEFPWITKNDEPLLKNPSLLSYMTNKNRTLKHDLGLLYRIGTYVDKYITKQAVLNQLFPNLEKTDHAKFVQLMKL
nr:uncharacterized protein LOC128705225 [Cherax quadricarinatus]